MNIYRFLLKNRRWKSRISEWKLEFEQLGSERELENGRSKVVSVRRRKRIGEI